jgi:DNA-binding IclR family transcriptional regulator
MESSSLVKAFSLLEILADFEGSASLNQLSFGVGMTKPTAHRILGCLVGLGYVRHDPGGVYRLTPKLRWVALGRSERRLACIADPLLRRLHVETGETVNLGILRRDRIFYVAVLESSHALRRVAGAQDSDPIFSTALGRAITANLPGPKIEQLLSRSSIEARTPQTTTDKDELKRILVDVHRRGYAIERDQTDLGVTCIAAAVIVRGEPIAAVSLSVPSARVDAESERRWTASIQATAHSLSRELVAAERITA